MIRGGVESEGDDERDSPASSEPPSLPALHYNSDAHEDTNPLDISESDKDRLIAYLLSHDGMPTHPTHYG